jgi:hypothetical protein
MEKFLLNSRLFKVTLMIAGLLFTATIFAQTTINNGQTILADDIPANTAIIINAGGTLEMNVAKTFSSLTTANAGESTITGAGALTLTTAITVAAGNTLSVDPPVTAPDLETADLTNQTATVAGPGAITVTSLTINGTNGNSATFAIGSGLTIETQAINGGNGNNSTEYNMIVDGILRIGGAIDASGPGSIDNLTANTGSTVEYNGVAQTIFATNYHHLVLSGTGAKAINAGGAATLVFGGNLKIAAGATLANSNKVLSVVGNWENDGVFTQGTGDVIFSGNSVQSIGGTQPTTFREIVFANTNGGVTLTKPVTVTLSATFTSGIVNSDAINVLIFSDGATSSLTPAMATTSSYVNGPVRKVGNDAFTFPIGAATGFVPLAMSAPNNVTDAYTAQYFRGVPVDHTNITAAGIDHISTCDYWDLNLTAEGGTAATINATFYWNANNPCGSPGNYITDPSTVRAVHYTGGSWSEASAGFGTGSNVAGSVIFAGLTSFSPFALASTSAAANPLPVVFADVKAYGKNNGVQIEWSNLTEKDVAEYTIERSANGRDFSAIGKQLPTSNQNDKASYDAFDATPGAGANYYRIKAEETTGKIVYSKILSVDLGKTSQGLKLYPNPVSGNQVTVSLSNVKRGQYNLRVINTAGQDIFKQLINNQSSSLTQTLDLPSTVKPGVYNLVVTGDDYRESKMFIVQ